MKKLSKKFLSLLMAAAMVVTIIPMGMISAQAAIKWTPLASSDFSSVNSVSQDTAFTPSTYNGMGNQMTWTAHDYGNALSVSNGAVYLPDGYMYLSGYSGGSVPITGHGNKWKIDFGFRFKTTNSGDDMYFKDADNRYSFLKMYVYADNLSNWNAKNDAYCYFAQNANGQCYSWNPDPVVGTKSRNTSVTTGNVDLTTGVDYHYIAEFDGTTFKAYINDNSGREVTHIVTTTESGFISTLNNISWATINAIKLGDDDNNMYFKGLEYRNITFYTDGTTNTSSMSAIDTLAAKISDYEAIMATGNTYKNMAAAYTAYVNANKAYDAYVYGRDTSVNVATYASNLQNAINNMEPWTGYTGTFTPTQGTFTNDSQPASYYNGHYSNLLYMPTGQGSRSGENDQNYMRVYISTPGRIVALYDGVHIASYPALGFVGDNGKTRGLSCFYIGDNDKSNNESNRTKSNDYIYLDSDWHWGGCGNYDFTWNEAQSGYSIPYYYSTTTISNAKTNGSKQFRGISGHICIKNDNITFSNGYYQTLSGTVYFVGRNYDSALHTYTSQNLNYITVVNYKPVYDQINSSTNKAKLADVANYKQGGLASLMTAYQAAQNFNPNNGYDYSSSIPAAYNTDMQAVVSAFTSASTTTDNAAYATMRSYLTNGLNTKSLGSLGSNLTAQQIYDTAGINNSTVANYDRFAAAYADAVSHMALLAGGEEYGHNATSTSRTAAQINAELSTAYNLLERKSAAATPTIGQLSGQNYLGIGDTISVASAEGSISGTVTYKIYYDVDNTAGSANTTATFAYGSSANVNVFPDNSHNKAIVTAKGNDTADGAATETVERTFYRINAPSFTGYYNPTLVAIPANGILDRDAILQAAKSATNDDSSIILQYSYNGGESWTDTADGQIDAFQVSGGKYASVSAVTIRSVVKSGGNVVAHSGTASVTLARQADFGIYVETAGSTAKFYDKDNSGADKIIIYDTENYSDDIVFTLQADGVAVSGTGEDVVGVFTYDKTNGIDLTGSSKAAEAINGADYVTIKAYSRDVKTGNYDTYATASFYNEGSFDKFIYHESFNGTSDGTTYTTNDERGVNITAGDTNSAGTTITVPEKAGDRQGFAKSETGTSADMRKNVLKISGTNQHTNNGGKEAFAKLSANPLSDDLAKVYAKENGVTISFWRAMQSGTNTKSDVPSGTLKRDAVAFRRQNPQDERDYFMIELTGNMSYAETPTDYFDIVPGEYDVTQNSLSKYSGYWQHIAVTINPKAASVEEAITVYIDGVPHPASTSYSQNYDISTSIDASGGEYAAASDTVAKTIGDLIDMMTDSSVDLCLAHDNQWQDYTDDIYLDDIRIYTDVLTQQDIWETYYDEYSDTPTLEGNRASVTHDPTTITVYKLKSASNGMAAGSLVGQEFIDYYNVPSSNYTVEYYSYGTGLQIYHSTDNVNWEIVGDNQGRVAYQSHDQFVKDNGNGTWSSLEYHTALSEVLTSIRNASDYNNSQKGAGHLVWAPHVSYNLTTNNWMMYVAISCWSGATSAIISMESADGTPVHFVARDSSNNQAYSVIVKSSGRPNAIDACTYYKYNDNGTIDPSTLYMAYGAWSQGEAKTEDLCTMQLNANGTAKYGASGIITYSDAMSAEDGTRICASQPSEPDGVTGEGAFITYHNGYYYLYVAYGVNDYNYVTRVFRSTSPTGPFVDYNGVQATNSSAVHGTQIMAPHYVTGDNYIYMSTGHDSIYKAVNNNGEVITIHSAHARPVSNNANGYKELPDYAMVTRQIALAGSVTITHAMFYTQSGWAISMPEQYDGTDTSHAITATQLDGLYKASTLHDIIDEGLTYSEKAKSGNTYSTNWDFSKYVYFLANDATSGEIYGTGDGFLPLDLKYELSYDTGDAATSTTTYITIKNGSGVTVAEGVVAMHNGTPELSYFNIEQGDFGGGVETRASSTVWSIKVDDLDAYADFNALDSAYAEGDSLLKSLDGKTAQYNATSVQNLMDRLAEAKADVAVSTAKKKLVPASSQSAINTKSDNITAAIVGLTPATAAVSEENFSTYEAAVSAINNIDPDAYEEVKDEIAPNGHIASAISTANTLVSSSSKTYENDYTIKVIDGTADQERVDLAVDTILDALSYCTKKYAVSADAGVTSIGSKNGTYKDGYATYGTSMTFRAASEDTAWNLEVTSNTSHKKPAFYGYGQSITVKVTGALDVTTETRSGSEKKVRILRHYDNSTNERVPVQFAEFVSAGSYTLPSAANTPAIAFYSFDGYYIGETKYAAGATVTISEDTDIIAKYKYNASASNAITATALSGGTSISGTYAYNAKLELKGGENAYGWSVDLGNGKYRPFYVGADLTYYAMDSLNLVAEDETTFKAHGYSLPEVYLRNGGAIDVSGSKITFNAQVVSDNMDSIQECGILVAVPNNKQPGSAETVTPVTPEDFQVIVENSGQQMGYAILRAKSTKFVGANQIAIAVNNLPEGYVYRAYAIYNHGGALETVYTDVVR